MSRFELICCVSARTGPKTEVMGKGPTYMGAFIGSFGGSLIPSLWGAGQFSLWSLVFFMIGGFVGIWVGYRLSA